VIFPLKDTPDLPQLFLIPITEQCKILPSPGIYAVSVESGLLNSKGMAIINRGSDNISDVLLNIFDELNLGSENKVTISFHKKIHSTISFSDSRSSSKIKASIEEISDLIY
jgi:hypothetical protein